MKLTCPIRGILNIEDRPKSGLGFTEEKRRIDLVHILMDKGYKLTNDSFEKTVMKLGNNGRNSLRSDIVIKDNSGKVVIVAEVKKDNNEAKSAKEHQLFPAWDNIKPKPEFAIYFDGLKNELFHNSTDRETPYSLSQLPKAGKDFLSKKVTIDDLQPILNPTEFFNSLDQLVHNLAIAPKERYSGIFQVILAKYFDEQFNKEDLKFITFSKVDFFEDLWIKAYKYYKNNADGKIPFVEKIVFEREKLKEIILFVSGYAFVKSPSGMIQDFFMKFGSKLLDKKDLDQYYTPITIVNFIVDVLDIKPEHLIIDPAGGSADFLAAVIQKYKNNDKYKNIKERLTYWDYSKDAAKVAFLNMILNGDGRTNIEIIDSIENWNKGNGEFDFVITNPPFGTKTKWNKDEKILMNYTMSKNSKELGVLFIERSMNLLNNNGVMAIVLPSGYLNNKQQKFIRSFLLDNYRIVADISLPSNAFKGADTGVKTDIIFVKKEKIEGNYKIFVDSVKNIGFDYSKKSLPPIYKLNLENGEFFLDKNNNRVLNNDFDSISSKFKSFAHDERLSGFEKTLESNIYIYI